VPATARTDISQSGPQLAGLFNAAFANPERRALRLELRLRSSRVQRVSNLMLHSVPA